MAWLWTRHYWASAIASLSYIIPWRSGSYTCFSNRSVAKNMADFGLCWRQIHAIWYLWLQVITTDQAQFWSRLNFHTLLVSCRILFCFLSFRGIKFCRFFSVFHVFWTFDHLFEYLQVLEVIPAGKGKKTSKYIRENNIWRHSWIAIKPQNLAVYIHEEIFQQRVFLSFNSLLLYINVCFMAMILHVLFLKLLKLLTCYLVFEVNVYIQIKAFGFLNYLRYS